MLTINTLWQSDCPIYPEKGIGLPLFKAQSNGALNQGSSADSLAQAKQELEILKADFNGDPSKYRRNLDLNIFQS